MHLLSIRIFLNQRCEIVQRDSVTIYNFLTNTIAPRSIFCRFPNRILLRSHCITLRQQNFSREHKIAGHRLTRAR